MNAIFETHNLTLEPYDSRRLANLCGQFDEHIRQIESHYDLDIRNRGNLFQLTGSPESVKGASNLLNLLYSETASHAAMTPERVHLRLREAASEYLNEPNAIDGKKVPRQPSKANTPAGNEYHRGKPSTRSNNATPAEHDPEEPGTAFSSDILCIKTRRAQIKPRGYNQKAYVQNMFNYDINFGIGPAGTGKTYLAVAAAVEALESEQVRRILLVRPAVEAGEKLGFLPGDLADKINPYLRPLYDALYEMLGFERVNKLMDRHIIEVAPLAYMRGRTLNHSFIILDESQNTTREQMKMFLTRIGFGSKAVITGDHTQVDLPRGTQSGLKHAMSVLDGIDDIGFTHFAAKDVVRHTLVQKIVEAYEAETEKLEAQERNSSLSREGK